MYMREYCKVPTHLSNGSILRASFTCMDRERGGADESEEERKHRVARYVRVVADAAKVADILILVFAGDEEIDEGSLKILRILRAQGEKKPKKKKK